LALKHEALDVSERSPGHCADEVPANPVRGLLDQRKRDLKSMFSEKINKLSTHFLLDNLVFLSVPAPTLQGHIMHQHLLFAMMNYIERVTSVKSK